MRKDSMKLTTAIRIAVDAHGEDVDLSGAPYILHPLRVMEAVHHLGESYMIVAVLHDVIEDTHLKLRYWLDAGGYIEGKHGIVLGQLAVDEAVALDAISRRPHPEETYREYLDRVEPNMIARMVKVADLRDNLADWRQQGLDPKTLKGINERHLKALQRLTGSDEWQTAKRLEIGAYAPERYEEQILD
jgi:(p)ppGpp synthase/HD superfamily hydrolase